MGGITLKTAFITGGTSGFGEAAARKFVKEGWQVVVTGRRAERLESLVKELGGDKTLTLPFDMRDKAAMESALSSLPAKFRDVDVLVNNAGLALGTAPVPQAKLEDWNRMIDTNITSLVTITHKLLPTLIKQKGVIVNMSSIAGTYPYPGGNVYGGTKAFVTQFSLGLRSDLHGTGVRVTSIEPGMAETEFTLVRTGGNQAVSDALYKGVRPLSAEDIADMIFWVATLPQHVNINRLEVMPVNQSSAGFQIFRES